MPEQNKVCSGLVPLTGLEPVRCFHRGILSPLCLPIPPQRHLQNCNAIIIHNSKTFVNSFAMISHSLVSSFGANRSIKYAPIGAVTSIERNATAKIVFPHAKPTERGIPPIAA